MPSATSRPCVIVALTRCILAGHAAMPTTSQACSNRPHRQSNRLTETPIGPGTHFTEPIPT